MRLLNAALIICLSFLLTSCFDILEEIRLNRDGSGTYAITMDMSELMSNPFMQEALKEEMAKEGQDQEVMKIDSSFSFVDAEDLPRDMTATERELIRRVQMRMQLDQEEGQMLITASYPFDDVDQLNTISRLFSRMQAREDAEAGDSTGFQNPFGMLGGIDDFASTESRFQMKKKSFSREATPRTKEDGSDEEELDESMEDMMRSIFADISFRTIYHLPGKVKKTTFENAEIDGNTLTVTYDMVDVMEGRPVMSGEIKFR